MKKILFLLSFFLVTYIAVAEDDTGELYLSGCIGIYLDIPVQLGGPMPVLANGYVAGINYIVSEQTFIGAEIGVGFPYSGDFYGFSSINWWLRLNVAMYYNWFEYTFFFGTRVFNYDDGFSDPVRTVKMDGGMRLNFFPQPHTMFIELGYSLSEFDSYLLSIGYEFSFR